MKLSRLVLKELTHRRLNFALAAAITAAAVACVVAVVAVLDAYRVQTDAVLADYQEDVSRSGEELADSMRKITKGLGFNVLILPAQQNLSDYYSDGYAAATMPEEYVDRLASMRIMTVDHLFPVLERSITWPEQGDRRFILIGIRGEVPLQGGDTKKPLVQPVPEGGIVLGSVLASDLSLDKGDVTTLMGGEFKVHEVYAPRGSKDDITAWVPLATAQAMLGQAGQINAIQALNCNCASLNMLQEVPDEIEAKMPGVRVIMQVDPAVARAEARNKANAQAKAALAEAAANRASLGQRLAGFASVLVPLVVLGGGVAVGLLAWSNVRERRGEIGILRAIGVRSSQVLCVFLAKALLVGVVGAGVGIAVGVAVGWLNAPAHLRDILTTLLIASAATLLIAPLLTVLASWLPALIASRQDPAGVLRAE